MTAGDILDYITLGNPVSKGIIASSGAIMRAIGLRPKNSQIRDGGPSMQSINVSEELSRVGLYRIVGRHYNFVRLAGLGGASAIFMGAYCKYYLKDVRDPKEQVESQSFADIANRIHFLHSFALMAMPLAHYPVFTGIMMTMGTLLFSGCMYYRALTGSKKLQHYTTIGGFCLIGAWLSLVV
ncbi:CG4686 [Drosophila busckii]|uniref:CG4686 n=1 Tax=Drosophila busckii TaxID=30019 RepID=A0A0M3QYB7_DROBS|nr:transmembrane protein 256 homolog [Drosophila busckii]ALC47339.1 CG4686 [Drosophila busckii]